MWLSRWCFCVSVCIEIVLSILSIPITWHRQAIPPTFSVGLLHLVLVHAAGPISAIFFALHHASSFSSLADHVTHAEFTVYIHGIALLRHPLQHVVFAFLCLCFCWFSLASLPFPSLSVSSVFPFLYLLLLCCEHPGVKPKRHIAATLCRCSGKS